ncbi:hypothetical protein [Collimonas sp.]|uniref:hypothetical protein n=1 Tax=Collimonas sp. TaxID=1963772 RepID=UPI002CF4DB03|nr:hypothetical protein [Collimonas sp.]HWX02788.1 hypothetical protein [Collimonas sp.]
MTKNLLAICIFLSIVACSTSPLSVDRDANVKRDIGHALWRLANHDELASPADLLKYFKLSSASFSVKGKDSYQEFSSISAPLIKLFAFMSNHPNSPTRYHTINIVFRENICISPQDLIPFFGKAHQTNDQVIHVMGATPNDGFLHSSVTENFWHKFDDMDTNISLGQSCASSITITQDYHPAIPDIGPR